MIIRTDRLIIRDINWEDLNNVHNLYSLPEIREFNAIEYLTDINKIKKEFRELIEEQSKERRIEYCWVIVCKSLNDFIGISGLHLYPSKFKAGNIYIMINPSYWKQGFGRETLKALLNYCFDSLNLHRIEAGTDIENKNAIKLLESIGMSREGIKRESLPIRNKWKNTYLYSILENDNLN